MDRLKIADQVAKRFVAGKTLKVGDRVMYKGGWGKHPAVEVTVVDLGLTDGPKSKKTIERLKRAPWKLIEENWVIIGVEHDEGASSWGYGYQFEPA